MKWATAFKGATHYELQVGRFWVMVCHLKGRYWRNPLRRLSWGIEPKEERDDG